MNDRTILAVAGSSLALATLCGALGAHELKGALTPLALGTFETAVRYQFYHSLGLLAVGIVAGSHRAVWIVRSAWLLIAGIALFSGSLYALTFGAPHVFGVLTPLGGLALIVGWVTFALAVRSAD